MRDIRRALFLLLLFLAACSTAVNTAPPEQRVTWTPGALPIEPTSTDALPPTDVPVTVTIAPTEVPSTPTDIPPTAAPPPTETPVPQPSPLPDGFIGPANYPEGVNPLTGLPVTDPAALERRPIVAKISNAPPLVRPQAGIGLADIVFEHYAEGGLTRFSAVLYGETPPRVGSIRSARLIDYELAAAYRALLVFAGGSTGIEEQIYGSDAIGIREARLAEGREIVPPSDFAERAFRGVSYGPPYYFRDETVPVPHNLFASPPDVWELASAQGVNPRPALQGMTFSADTPPGETSPANTVDVRYRATRVQWFYDEETSTYQRMSDGQWHAGALTGERVRAENVVVLFAHHEFSDIVESEWQGNRSYGLLIRLWFEGDAFVARDGRLYDVRWLRPTRESLISFETESGEIFPLKPGKTWFQVVRLPEQQEPESEWVRVE